MGGRPGRGKRGGRGEPGHREARLAGVHEPPGLEVQERAGHGRRGRAEAPGDGGGVDPEVFAVEDVEGVEGAEDQGFVCHVATLPDTVQASSF